jgi:hypothetical protein
MKLQISVVALLAGLCLSGSALAQGAPVGGPSAKGNAPLKNTHTVNDGAAKQGANSFTQNEARKHILNAGYSSVSGLAKGTDGVWHGTAMKAGANYNVAMDFKGNVTDGGVVAASTTTTKSANTAASTTTTTAATATDKPMMAPHRHRHHHHRHHAMMMHHKEPCMVNGAACSGADKNHDGIADKDEHKAKP